MLDSFLYALGILVFLFGLYHLFENIYKYFMCRKNYEGIYTVIFHFEAEELLPDKVYSALFLTGYKSFGNRDVYVIDRDYEENTKLKCKLLAGDMGTVHFIKIEDLRRIYKINSNND